MATTFTDQDVVNVLKEFYDGQEVSSLLGRNSPVLEKIEKRRVGGKEYPVPYLTSGSGAVCADFSKVKAGVARWGKTDRASVGYNSIFSSFTVSLKEMEAAKKDAGSFVDLIMLKSFSALDGLRKVFGLSLYGKGDGFIGSNTVAIATGNQTITVNNYSAAAIDLGTQIVIADKDGTLIPSYNPTITAIERGDSTSVLTLSDVIPSITQIEIGEGSIYIDGCGTPDSPLLPVGLDAWLPTVADRTGDDWNTYIKKAFFGVDRSKYTARLAGNFVKQGAGEKIADCVVRLLQRIRTAGGVPDMVVMNPEDYNTMISELGEQLKLMQNINTADKKNKNEVVRGISDFKFAFSTSWLEYVIDDPLCPKGKVYIIDQKKFKFISLSNVTPIVNAETNNVNPGAPEIVKTSKAPDQYNLNFDDFCTVQPFDLPDGPGFMATFRIFGNFILTAPAHCGVAVLNAA